MTLAVNLQTGFDPTKGGTLGETPILWRFRMQYAWNDQLADEHPDWDQCCTCWVFAVSEARARELVWGKFAIPNSVMPVSIASCLPERYQNPRDIALEREWAEPASVTGTGTAKTAQPVEGRSPARTARRATPNPLSHAETKQPPFSSPPNSSTGAE